MLWSASFAQTSIQETPLHPLLQRLSAGESDPDLDLVQELLQRQGYFAAEVAPAKHPENWVAWDRFDFSAFCNYRADQPQIHAFPGGGWVYACRPGLDPCLECLLRRWLGNAFLGEAGHELCRPGRSFAWEPLWKEPPPAPSWGFVAHLGETHRLLPSPLCRRCHGLELQAPGALYGPWGLLPRGKPWSELPDGFWVASAHPGESLWLTGDEGYPGGTGASLVSPEVAALRASGEAVERYCASFAGDHPEAVTLRHARGSLSHGLACARSLAEAQQKALQELVERDATALFWGRQRGAYRLARSFSLPLPLRQLVVQLPGLGWPVYACVLADDQGRPACGAACGEPEKAVEEAFHNYLFLARNAQPTSGPPRDFSEHLSYYWFHPDLFPWDAWGGSEELESGPAPEAQFYDLTTADARACGLYVVRAVCEGLVAIPDNHSRWPSKHPRWRQQVGKKAPRLPHPFG